MKLPLVSSKVKLFFVGQIIFYLFSCSADVSLEANPNILQRNNQVSHLHEENQNRESSPRAPLEKMIDTKRNSRNRRLKRISGKSRENRESQDTLWVPKTDGDFMSLGYKKITVSPDKKNQLDRSFAIWGRESEEGYDLEAIGYPAVLVWGDTQAEALENLIVFIEENLYLARMSDNQLAGSSLEIARFIRLVKNFKKA